jgi:putative DNA primase/helicase
MVEYDPRPEDMITKVCGAYLAPAGAPHPAWDAFLNRVLPDKDLQAFLQRFMGYCCTGFTDEHVFLFLYGSGANGKSVFVNTVTGVLGDYAVVADINTFVTANINQERHPTDLAKLFGARLAVATETQKGRRWDEAKLKQATGGDKITARFMRQDFFDFEPQFKLIITGNHRPRISTSDEAMRRRMLLIPFTVMIPPAERDTKLGEKLKAEWPAIMRWMVDGCVEWKRIGLAVPAVIRQATDEYLEDQDTLGQWLGECTEPVIGTFTLTSELFSSWKAWCETRNIPQGSVTAFAEGLKDRHFGKKRQGGTGRQGFEGIAIKTQV